MTDSIDHKSVSEVRALMTDNVKESAQNFVDSCNHSYFARMSSAPTLLPFLEDGVEDLALKKAYRRHRLTVQCLQTIIPLLLTVAAIYASGTQNDWFLAACVGFFVVYTALAYFLFFRPLGRSDAQWEEYFTNNAHKNVEQALRPDLARLYAHPDTSSVATSLITLVDQQKYLIVLTVWPWIDHAFSEKTA